MTQSSNTPKLSVIVPVYNAKPYLQRCVNSILAQTFIDFELILVDDGSTDGSGYICDSIAAEEKKVVVIHQTNKGQAVAKNVGIKRAVGDFVTIVDSDDWIEPQMYEEMMNSINQYNADIVICRVKLIEESSSANFNNNRVIGYDIETVFNKQEATKEILRDDKIPSFPWNKIYRRELFKDVEYHGRVFDDTATTYKLFYNAEIVVAIPYIGYNYWLNPESVTKKNKNVTAHNIMRDLDNALAFDERYVFAKNHDDLAEVVPQCAYKAYFMIRNFIHMLGHKRSSLTIEQEEMVNKIMSSFDSKDLCNFSLLEKMDLYLFHFSRPLLKAYLKIVPLLHKMKE